MKVIFCAIITIYVEIHNCMPLFRQFVVIKALLIVLSISYSKCFLFTAIFIVSVYVCFVK